MCLVKSKMVPLEYKTKILHDKKRLQEDQNTVGETGHHGYQTDKK